MTGHNGYTFAWTERRLTSAISEDADISYTYNHNGIRTSKTVNGITIYYEVDENNNVIKQYELQNDVESNVIEFVYDSNSSPIYMVYNETLYYYEKNMQGDIVAILDTNGDTVVEYTYNIWGELVSTTGTLADTIGIVNPLRYRGYYYDTETSLYYLQSRYYAPDLMRFISQDDPMLSNAQGQPLGSNLYAYCLNNPVNYSDHAGSWVMFKVAYNSLRKTVAYANYIYNSLLDNFNGYINGQALGQIAKLRFGLFNMSYNGCEVIAIYNALRLKKKGISISKIAFEMEVNGASTLFGVFGSNPYFIGLFLTAHQVKYNMTFKVSELKKYVKNNAVFIISFWTGKTLLSSIHTVAVQYKSGKYYVYNYNNKSKSEANFSSFEKIYKDGKFIVGYYLK